jgi:hypothetical protein
MAGAWYVHTIDFQQHGKDVIGVVQLFCQDPDGHTWEFQQAPQT